VSDRSRKLLLIVLAVAILAVVGIILFKGGDDSSNAPPAASATPTPTATVEIPTTTKVDGPDADTAKDDIVTLSPQAQENAQDFVEDPKDLESVPGAVPLSGTGPQTSVGVVPGPLATQEIPGCRTRFLRTNFSSRSVPLSQVRAFDLHFTAGKDQPGTRADVDGLTAYGNQPSARVSWHFNMDKDGNCDYNVPLTQKAWTIANKNSYGIEMEVAGSGESPYLRDGGYKQLARIMKAVKEAGFDIPIRLGKSVNCKVTVSGIDTHWRSGLCSGGHTDIKPQVIEAVIAKLKTYMGASDKPDTAGEKEACNSLRYHRQRVKKGASWQDLVTNKNGTRLKRYIHANAKKAFLDSRHVNNKKYCS
jgi:hypothetical protein